MTTAASTTTATPAEFARMTGRTRQAIHQLIKAGKLTCINGRIPVALGLHELAQLRPRPGATPDLADVASGRAAPASAEDEPPAGGSWRARREQAQARMAEVELEERLGKLLRADQVLDAASEAGTAFRNALESLPYSLAPALANKTEQEIASVLDARFEQLLRELCVGLGKMSPPAP
jgi:hypothetical protein